MPRLLAAAQRWERDRDLELQISGGGKKARGEGMGHLVDTVTWTL